MGKLTALKVKNARPGDRLADGEGLRLDVDDDGNASWILRFTSPTTGRERFMGLGPLRAVSLSAARDAADDARRLIRSGADPIDARKAARTAARVEAARGIRFKDYAEQYITAREGGWKNPIHRQQWRNSLRDYAFPVIGNFAVADVDTEAVLKVLRPIWTTKAETARRVRGRIESILNAAKAEGLREGENPAMWRGHLDQVLARRRKSDVKHHAALPYEAMPEFWKSLLSDKSDAARLLRFIVLTVARFSEAAKADRGEFDTGKRLWTVPAARMKATKPHVVPLTEAALREVGKANRDLVFASPLTGKALSDVALADVIKRHTTLPATTHGMRSTFRDWCGDCTSFPREVAEAALAHTLENEVEAAYRRSTAIEKRKALMTTWADFLDGKS